ncbi:hypothetical protein KKA14_09570, partial [bacterium]|nr:hypothetical protein [bacterium]
DFRHAHHCAGFWGLLSDRLADGQAKRNKTTDIFQDFFKQCWILSLTKATEKNNSEIVNLVNSAIADWEKGIRLERKFFRPGLLTVEDYTETIRLKVYWLSLTSICLLQSLDQQSQIKSFQLIYNMMLCGMQSRDDAMDFIEDEALNGISYPDALGVTPGSLYRNGLELLKKSSLLAKDLGFIKLSNWLDQNSQVHFQIRFDEFPELDILGGWMLSTQVEAKLKM